MLSCERDCFLDNNATTISSPLRFLYCTCKLLDLAGRGLWNKESASPCEEGGGGRRKEELDEEAEEEEESG